MKKIQHGWILICYDIPAGEGSLRKRVLRRLHSLGALQFTESVYYMPHSPGGLKAAREVSNSGEVFVWYSKVEGDDARLLTTRFLLEIAQQVEDLEGKVWKAEELLASVQPIDWRLKSLNREYRGLVRSVELIGSEAFAERLGQVRQRIDALKKSCRRCVHFTSLDKRPFCRLLKAFLAPETLSRPCDNFEESV